MKTETTLQCSTFTGFSKHKEDKELLTLLAQIANGHYRKPVSNLRLKLNQLLTDEAAHIKKQLPSATLSATYNPRRIPENITGYNDVIMLDFDKLSPDNLIHCRRAIEADSHTLFCFLSPSGNGLKTGVYLQTPEAMSLRQTLQRESSISFDELEMYHKQMFELAKSYYEILTGVSVDASGSDIGRLFFLSHDPDVYINHIAIASVQVPILSIIPPVVTVNRTPKEWRAMELPGIPETDCTHIPTAIQSEFKRCVGTQDRFMKYEPGQRDTYLFGLGNRCYRKKLPIKAVEVLVVKHFGTPDMDVRQPIRNAYKYTGKTDRKEAEKKKPVGKKIVEFADNHYDIRYNVIMKRFEYREKNSESDFVPMKEKHLNSIFLDLNLARINCTPSIVKTIIKSRYAKDFNPFEAYFPNLQPWDGVTDHIGELAETVQTTNQAFWCDCLKRWLVGLVACALDDNVVNQLALVIKGAQGKGKSTWIRNLLPPELKLHYRNGMLNPNNKDHAFALTMCLIINLEEFEGMSAGDIGELKRLITQESVMERKAYDTDADLYIRRASIIASTNEPRFLQDISGTRRFPTVTALEIDYRKLVNHAGIYAQALYLWKNNFRYWYENHEIDDLNRLNLEYSLATPEEELFHMFYTKPQPTDYTGVKWLPAAAILTHLSIYGKIQVTNRSQRMLTRILEQCGFEKRRNENDIFEYGVRLKDTAING